MNGNRDFVGGRDDRDCRLTELVECSITSQGCSEPNVPANYEVFAVTGWAAFPAEILELFRFMKFRLKQFVGCLSSISATVLGPTVSVGIFAGGVSDTVPATSISFLRVAKPAS